MISYNTACCTSTQCVFVLFSWYITIKYLVDLYYYCCCSYYVAVVFFFSQFILVVESRRRFFRFRLIIPRYNDASTAKRSQSALVGIGTHAYGWPSVLNLTVFLIKVNNQTAASRVASKTGAGSRGTRFTVTIVFFFLRAREQYERCAGIQVENRLPGGRVRLPTRGGAGGSGVRHVPARVLSSRAQLPI